MNRVYHLYLFNYLSLKAVSKTLNSFFRLHIFHTGFWYYWYSWI